eukprot:sb/3471815/
MIPLPCCPSSAMSGECNCAQWQEYLDAYNRFYIQQQTNPLPDNSGPVRGKKKRRNRPNITPGVGGGGSSNRGRPVRYSESESYYSEEDRAELAAFLRQSRDHRAQVRSDRETQSRVQLEEVNFERNDTVNREYVMEKLYGEGKGVVAELEARLSLVYETYCDENQPVLWPVLPLKLR